MMWSNEIPSDVARLCDFLCGLSSADGADLQEILEELNMRERLSLTLVMLKKELRMFELQRELAKEVEAKISTNQRKYFLHEQLKQIKRELGIEKVLKHHLDLHPSLLSRRNSACATGRQGGLDCEVPATPVSARCTGRDSKGH